MSLWQSDIADELNIDVKSYHRYKKFTTLIPELQEMVDSGSLTTSVASRFLARLSPTDQKQLILTYGKGEIIVWKIVEIMMEKV